MRLHKASKNNNLRRQPPICSPESSSILLTKDNTPDPVLWPLLNVILPLLCGLIGGLSWWSSSAFAQNPPVHSAPSQEEPPPSAPQVTRADAMALHALVEQWVKRAHVPRAEELEWSRPVQDVAGVQVTLRWGGMLMGRGQAFVETLVLKDSDLRINRQSVDLIPLIRRAAEVALQQARSTLETSSQEASRSTGSASLSDSTLEKLSPRFCVDLQVARIPVLLPVNADVDAATLARHVAAGYHGLVLIPPATAPTAWIWLWPADAIASNTDLAAQLMQLRAQAGLHPLLSARSRERRRLPIPIHLARFEVIHVVRPTLDQDVLELIRGNPPVSETIISEAQLEKLADQLTGHLLSRVRRDGSVAGTYRPSTDRFESEQAFPAESALTAYALARRAAYLKKQTAQWSAELSSAIQNAASPSTASTTTSAPFRRDNQIRDCIQAADRIFHRLLRSGESFPRRASVDLATAAIVVLAQAESPELSIRSEEIPPLLEELAQQARQWCIQNPDQATPEAEDSAAGPAPAEPPPIQSRTHSPVRALVLASLAAGYEQRRNPELFELTSRLADRLILDRAAQDPAALPWLVQAEIRLNRLRSSHGIDTSETRLNSLVKTLADWRRYQVRPGLLIGPADVVGGVDWRMDFSVGPPRPDWRTAHVLMAWASVLSYPQAVDPRQQAGWLLDCASAGAFIQRLTFQPAHCFYVRSPADVLGGVRLAFWDNRLAAGPSAMALLAVTQLQETLPPLRPMLQSSLENPTAEP